jgi:hypothetical protein
MLDQLNEAAASLSGTWVKLRTTDDPPVEGKVLDFEDRAKTFEGAPVLSRKSGTQRREWVFTIDAGGDDPVKLSLNEAGQRAVAAALREAGSKANVGDTLKIAVAADPPGDREQATYKARWTPAPAGLGVPATSDSGADPF